LAEKNKQTIRSVEMNFINNSFWLTDKSHIQFTPIAKRNKINPVKSCQNLMEPVVGKVPSFQSNKKVF
jgi:hypothetical protein